MYFFILDVLSNRQASMSWAGSSLIGGGWSDKIWTQLALYSPQWVNHITALEVCQLWLPRWSRLLQTRR